MFEIKYFMMILLAGAAVAMSASGYGVSLQYFKVISDAPLKIEGRPAHQIAIDAIQSVAVRKERIYGSSPEELRDFRKRVTEDLAGKPRSDNKSDLDRYDFFYSLTFKLTPSAWKRELFFTKNNLDQRFQLKFGKYDLGVTIVGPIIDDEISNQNREFTLYTSENDGNKVKEMLSPLKNKVSWK